MARYIERNRHDWFGTVWKLAVFLGVALVAILVVYPWRGFWPTLLLILGGLWVYVGLLSRATGYVCARCGRAFQVPTTVNFFTASSIGKTRDGAYYSYKRLTCPHCGRVSKARLVKRVGSTDAKGSRRRLK